MTTLVGIKTNAGDIEAIVLGADSQLGIFDENGNFSSKKTYRKIVIGDFWALAHTGGVTAPLRTFYNQLTRPGWFRTSKEEIKTKIEKAIKSSRFLEVNELNSKEHRMNQLEGKKK